MNSIPRIASNCGPNPWQVLLIICTALSGAVLPTLCAQVHLQRAGVGRVLVQNNLLVASPGEPYYDLEGGDADPTSLQAAHNLYPFRSTLPRGPRDVGPSGAPDCCPRRRRLEMRGSANRRAAAG